MKAMEQQVRGGDGVRAEDRMFVDAWNRTRAELARRARRLANGHPDRAEDMLAATAMKALLFMRRSPEAMTDPDGFLFVVLRHVFLDGVRRQLRERGVIDHAADVDDERVSAAMAPVLTQMQRVELQDQLDSVVAAVRRLSRDQKRLFGLRFVQDLPYPVIAKRLGVNQALVRKRVQLLRARLRKTEAGPDGPS